MSRLFNAYIGLLQRYTLPTQMATGGVTSGLGDLICQHGVERKPFSEHDWTRTLRLVPYGAFLFAPVANRWHFLLNKVTIPGRKYATVAARMGLDMAFFAPFATFLFFNAQGIFQGRSLFGPGGTREWLHQHWFDTVKYQWLLFQPVQALNLSVVPVYARPPVLNLVSIVWNVFLSGRAADEGPSGERERLDLSKAMQPLE